MDESMQQGVLVLAHGSRNEQAREQYRRLASLLAERIDGLPVGFSVLEFPGEGLLSIKAGVAALAACGAERIVALPYFLFAAGHVKEDLARELSEAAFDGPVVRLTYQPPLGVDPVLLEVLVARAASAEVTLPGGNEGQTALLLVGAGTSAPDANADLFRAGRLIWERKRYGLVEAAFVSLTGPTVPEALERCLALGARRIVVAPYFLNTGRLSRRIDAALEEARARHPEVPMALAEEIGLHPLLVELLVERARRGLANARDGLLLPPCAINTAPWGCWLSSEH